MRGKGSVVALPALLVAGSIILLFLASVVPTGMVGLVAVAGLLPAAAVVSHRVSAGWFTYGGTVILALVLLPGRFVLLLYGLFFGLYPMVKWWAEQRRSRVVEWVIKLAFTNGMLALLWTSFRTLFIQALPLESVPLPLVHLGCSVVFILYDIGFSRAIALYRRRVDSTLNKGH